MILAFHGPKYSGKNTAAEIMISHFGGYECSFARRIKEVCQTIFGLSAEETDGVYKERPFDVLIDIDAHLTQMSEMLGLALEPRGLRAESPRKLMQYIGTEYVRSVQDNYWIAYLMEQIRADDRRPAYIVDCRFENERAAVYAAGGVVVHLRREVQSVDAHVSEKPLPVKPGDIVIYNDATLHDLEQRLLVQVGRG